MCGVAELAVDFFDAAEVCLCGVRLRWRALLAGVVLHAFGSFDERFGGCQQISSRPVSTDCDGLPDVVQFQHCIRNDRHPTLVPPWGIGARPFFPNALAIHSLLGTFVFGVQTNGDRPFGKTTDERIFVVQQYCGRSCSISSVSSNCGLSLRPFFFH